MCILSLSFPKTEIKTLNQIKIGVEWRVEMEEGGEGSSVDQVWAQEEYAARTITPANGRKQDHPNSASQAATAAASVGTKALKRPPVENPSATDPCGTKALKPPCVKHPSGYLFVGKQDHPNSASEVTAAAGTAAKGISLASLKELRGKYNRGRYGCFLERGRIVRKFKWWDGPIIVAGNGIPSIVKSAVIFPKPPLKEDEGVQVKSSETFEMQSINLNPPY